MCLEPHHMHPHGAMCYAHATNYIRNMWFCNMRATRRCGSTGMIISTPCTTSSLTLPTVMMTLDVMMPQSRLLQEVTHFRLVAQPARAVPRRRRPSRHRRQSLAQAMQRHEATRTSWCTCTVSGRSHTTVDTVDTKPFARCMVAASRKVRMRRL